MAELVTVVVAQGRYAAGDGIAVSVVNGLLVAIRVADHQSGCTIVSVERQSGSSWQAQNPCLLRSPTRLVALASGSVTAVAVPPPDRGWALGAYRVTLTYRMETGDAVTAVASAGFRVE